MSVYCSHPLIKPLPNCTVRGNHIPHFGAAPSLPCRWKVTPLLPSSAAGGFSAWRQGLHAQFQRCHWQWEKENSVNILFLLYFPAFSILSPLEWINEKPVWLRQQPHLVRFLTAFAMSILSWHWRQEGGQADKHWQFTWTEVSSLENRWQIYSSISDSRLKTRFLWEGEWEPGLPELSRPLKNLQEECRVC